MADAPRMGPVVRCRSRPGWVAACTAAPPGLGFYGPLFASASVRPKTPLSLASKCFGCSQDDCFGPYIGVEPTLALEDLGPKMMHCGRVQCQLFVDRGVQLVRTQGCRCWTVALDESDGSGENLWRGAPVDRFAMVGLE
jgi:hypothetical protein